jgi:hypothetical protein
MAALRPLRASASRGVRWGVACHAAPQQPVSGDLEVALPYPNGILLGAVDGLGHGSEAAHAARRALDVLREQPGDDLPALFARCHQALVDTRGVVMSLAAYAPETGAPLSWLGVGNVEGLLVRPQAGGPPLLQSQLLRSGVVGYMVPKLAASEVEVLPGDILVMATDGVRGDLAELVVPRDPPQRIADRILAERLKGWDDALVLVARLGERSPR